MKKISFIILIFLYFSFLIKSQERLITGRITDYKGKPLGGVNITAKDYPTLTTISGVDGEFRIEIFDFTKVLIFSFADMQTKELILGDQDRLIVVMEYMAMKNPDPWSLILNLNTGRSDVANKSKESDQSWNSKGDAGSGAFLEIEYLLTKNIGLGTGIGYNTYANKSYLKQFNNYGQNYLQKIDKDNESYYLYNEVSSVDERIKVKAISFPVKLKFHFRAGKKLGFFTDIGIKMIYATSATVVANGSSIWQGYYPQYHIVLYDLPEYGFVKYNINSENPIIDYNKFQYSFILSLGMSYRIKKEFNIDFGVYFDNSLSDLKYDKPIHQADYLNTIGKIDKTTLKGLGLMLGFRFHFVRKR